MSPYRAAFLRSMSASAAASCARSAADPPVLHHLGRRADRDREVRDVALDDGVRTEHAATADDRAA